MTIVTPSGEYEFLFDFKKIEYSFGYYYPFAKTNHEENVVIYPNGLVEQNIEHFLIENNKKGPTTKESANSFTASEESIKELITSLDSFSLNKEDEMPWADDCGSVLKYYKKGMTIKIERYIMVNNLNIDKIIGRFLRSNNQEFLCFKKEN